MKNNREELSEILEKRGYKNEDLINEIEQIYNKQQLPIQGVSQQRELLLAYHRYLTEELSLDLHEIWVDEHLKANNCG